MTESEFVRNCDTIGVFSSSDFCCAKESIEEAAWEYLLSSYAGCSLLEGKQAGLTNVFLRKNHSGKSYRVAEDQLCEMLFRNWRETEHKQVSNSNVDTFSFSCLSKILQSGLTKEGNVSSQSIKGHPVT